MPSAYDIHRASHGKIHHVKIGKPSIFMGHPYHGYVTNNANNQRVKYGKIIVWFKFMRMILTLGKTHWTHLVYKDVSSYLRDIFWG